MRPPFVALLVLLFPLTNARAREVEPSDEDRALVARVATAIIAQADPVEGWAWPPLAYIVNYQGSGIDEDRDGEIDADEVNANAMLRYVRPGEEVTFDDDVNATRIELPDLPTIAGEIDADGEVAQPVIRIYQGWLTVIAQGQDALLANCFGHELAHVVLKHVGESEPGAPIVENAIQRRQEADADLLGFQLAVAAGYPVEKLLDSLTREREVLYLYSDIEAYRYRHPGHATRVALVDEHRVEVWRSLGSFENGVYLLANELYPQAAASFEQVVQKHPECYEAWANRGYALLMMYCDQLDETSLRDRALGQLVVGGYYRRADSLGVRGPAHETWVAAVEALRKALSLQPELVVARANLAAAYLLAPEGAAETASDASAEFELVLAALEAGRLEGGVDARTHAALLVNAGAAELAAGESEAAEALFARARELFASQDEYDASGQVAAAILYNRALLLARSSEAAQRRAAVREFESYLRDNNSALVWWSLAYEEYQRLCQEQGLSARPRDELAAPRTARLRMVLGVSLPDGRTLGLDDTIEQVEALLGPGLRTNASRGGSIVRLRYLDLGLDILCDSRVLAIRLLGERAPGLLLQASGAGGGAPREIRAGMTLDEATALLGSDGNAWVQRVGTRPFIVYRYFSRLGFGVRTTDDGRITEVIVAQIPESAAL